MAVFTAGSNVATGDTLTATRENQYTGAGGSVDYLNSTPGPLTYADFTTAAAPAAPGAAKGRFYVVTGDRPGFRSGAAGAAEVLATRDATETLTNKTLTSPVINTGATGTGIGASAGLVAAGDHTTPAMTATVAGHVPTPPNNTTTFLRGDGTFAAPAAGDNYWDAQTASIEVFWDNMEYVTLANHYNGYSGGFSIQSDATTGTSFARINAGNDLTVPNAIDMRPLRLMRVNENPTVQCIVANDQSPVGGTVHYVVGFVQGNTPPTDGVYFRSSNLGNWFLVCRAASVETTVDMGVAPSGTKVRLAYVITAANSVQGYVNGVATGVAITTNIPSTTTRYQLQATVYNITGTVTTAGRMALYGWGWKTTR